MGKTPKVFIVQEVMRRDPVSKDLRRAYDLTPAAVYGELTVLITAEKLPLTPAPIVRELRRKLEGFCDQDYLLAVGDPVAIAIAAAVAAEFNNGKVPMLKWDREARRYIPQIFNVSGAD